MGNQVMVEVGRYIWFSEVLAKEERSDVCPPPPPPPHNRQYNSFLTLYYY